mmetsp:Transcript_136243/g.240814  ORF Transcript_136243/g.240814 Transcript_136243/m.240814 type:complete len:253 (+) Transcript_136243:85-843(+)
MVLPMLAHVQGSIRDLPEEAQHMVPYLKVCIVILWILGMSSVLLTRDVLFAITILAPAIMGTFLLPEDPHFNLCYERLRQSIFGIYCCANVGLSNLAPFFLITAVNATFLGFNLAILIKELRYDEFLPMFKSNPLQIIKVVAFVTQLCTSILSYRLLKLVPLVDTLSDRFQGAFYERLPGLSSDEQLTGSPGRPDHNDLSEGTPARASAGSSGNNQTAPLSTEPPRIPGPRAPSVQSCVFTPFAGQGHKLRP